MSTTLDGVMVADTRPPANKTLLCAGMATHPMLDRATDKADVTVVMATAAAVARHPSSRQSANGKAPTMGREVSTK